MSDPDAAAERRRSARRRALKEAKVLLSDWTAIDCLIRDLSDIGARLEFPGPTELPKEFDVLIVSSNQLVRAERTWQRGLAVGVRFTAPGREAPRKL